MFSETRTREPPREMTTNGNNPVPVFYYKKGQKL